MNARRPRRAATQQAGPATGPPPASTHDGVSGLTSANAPQPASPDGPESDLARPVRPPPCPWRRERRHARFATHARARRSRHPVSPQTLLTLSTGHAPSRASVQKPTQRPHESLPTRQTRLAGTHTRPACRPSTGKSYYLDYLVRRQIWSQWRCSRWTDSGSGLSLSLDPGLIAARLLCQDGW